MAPETPQKVEDSAVLDKLVSPMPIGTFNRWFADYLAQSPLEVERLLCDRTAVQFLIAWSLLETGCFHGFAQGKELKSHCTRLVEVENFDAKVLAPIVAAFHSRYKNKKRYANLMHDHALPDIKDLLARPILSLSPLEKVFLVVSVIFRYRNNIFHGTKGVQSWLVFKPQIEQCIQAMQHLLSHGKAVSGEEGKDAA